MGRLQQQFRETSARRDALAPEIERLGEQRVENPRSRHANTSWRESFSHA
jgi:hypothetical protein